MNAPEIRNRLAEIRKKRDLSAAGLAAAVNVTRQTIYAIEAGTYIPNTAVALRLAKILEVDVESLFILPEESDLKPARSEQVTFLPYADLPRPGQPVQLCRVDKRTIASAPSPVPWYLPASDAAVTEPSTSRGKGRVQVFDPAGDFSRRILIAGCDPGISVLARHAQTAGIELILAHRNSSQSLALLKQGCIHVAGTHLRDDASGESNVPEIRREFSKNSVAVISYAVWEEGLVVARGNPKNIQNISDLTRKGVSMVNREAGAGSRVLLDAHLHRFGIPASQVAGYDRTAPGHLPAAWEVQMGTADCCIATRGAAQALGLAFIPLATERYDLAIRRAHLDVPAMQALLDILSRAAFRRELEGLGGYDTRETGSRVL